MSSAGVAAWIAQVVFWALLLVGELWGDLGIARGVVFVALWVVGYFGLPLLPSGGLFFSPYVAVLDLVLVFLVLKGDLRLT